MPKKEKTPMTVTEAFDISKERVEGATERFRTARANFVAVSFYGSAEHAQKSKVLFKEASECYAQHMITHARIVEQLAAES